MLKDAIRFTSDHRAAPLFREYVSKRLTGDEAPSRPLFQLAVNEAEEARQIAVVGVLLNDAGEFVCILRVQPL